jgi:hypothetical protein
VTWLQQLGQRVMLWLAGMLRSAGSLAILLCGLLGAVSGGRAQLRRPSLHFTRGEHAVGCIDPRTLASRVEALTGPVFVTPQGSDYAIEGHIEGQPAGFVLRLSVTGPDGVPRGERVVQHEGDDCRGFDTTVVFLIALTIDPDLTLEQAVPPSGLGEQAPAEVLLAELTQHPPVPVALAPAAPVAPPPPAPTAAARTAKLWRASLGPSFSAGELPRPGLGVSAQLAVALTRWLSVGAQLRSSSLLRSVEVAELHRLRATSFAGALLACLSTDARHRLVFGGCVGPEPSRLRARGLDFSRESVARLTSWGALVQLELSLRVRPAWSLAVQTFLRAQLQDERLVYTSLAGANTVWGPGPVAGGVTFALVRHFGSGSAPARDTEP